MTAAIPWIEPDQRTALVKDADQWSLAAQQVTAFLCIDDAGAAYARDMAKQARTIHREIEEKRKTITTPLLAAKNATDALFRPTLDALTAIKRHYEQEIARYDLERERARAAVLVQSAEELAVGIVPTEPIPEPVHIEKTAVRHVWDPEIVDADLVPREYCSPDYAKLKAAVWYADTPHKPPQDIPGVKFALRSIVVVR